MGCRVKPLDAIFGAEVIGLDLTKPLSDDDFAYIHQAHLDYQVLVFRDQHITPKQHIAFSRRFGTLTRHVLGQFHLPEYPEILIVSNVVNNEKPIGVYDAGAFWHSDGSFKGAPSLGSLLHAQALPEEGGDTLFANMYLAWETLPQALRNAVAERWAVHDYQGKEDDLNALSRFHVRPTPQQLANVPPVAHPIVRVHPETGRRALFVSEAFTTHIVGMPSDESEELLQRLFSHSVLPAHVYRHQWRVRDLVFWDNRCLLHRATPRPEHSARTLYRTTVDGDKPY